ncbi:hypothetical protein WICPIJ_006907 [Wickerhamomyces pijperi]|uniref:Uncharacterized protein n=1 Tax=Wickerhamomyces pijperi TaxID=599730 RepID=A0A9P8Q3C0_WICPI|nr:hypothetical protein WICPIJ_006907 [Wickerhamomyces pijperi]
MLPPSCCCCCCCLCPFNTASNFPKINSILTLAIWMNLIDGLLASLPALLAKISLNSTINFLRSSSMDNPEAKPAIGLALPRPKLYMSVWLWMSSFEFNSRIKENVETR